MSRNTAILALPLFLCSLAAADPGDPPARVARLNYVSGSVSFQPAGVDEWAPATLNYPLSTADSLWVDQGGRAELHIGSTALRLAQQTSFGLTNLDDRLAQIRLTEGALLVRVRYLASDETIEINTPNLSVTLVRAGEYRIEALPDRQVTRVTVRDGRVEAYGQGGDFSVFAGQTARVSGDDMAVDMRPAFPPDELEHWAEARDRREDAAASARYLSRDMTGYEDLDEYGAWESSPDYGSVWVPARVDPGWAPYRYGHWVYRQPWGWTWVDDAPWGFAPFHYGRWANWRGRWCWIPGPPAPRPVYAPALVAFVGGNNWSASLSMGHAGGVAWFPLGPREVYRPGYRVSDIYVRNVNHGHVTNITNVNVTNIYINQSVHGAVTAVPHDTFVGARPVRGAAVIVPPRVMMNERHANFAPPVAPVRESAFSHPVGHGAPVMRPPDAVVRRPVFTRTAQPTLPHPSGNPQPDRGAWRQTGAQERPVQQTQPQQGWKPAGGNSEHTWQQPGGQDPQQHGRPSGSGPTPQPAWRPPSNEQQPVNRAPQSQNPPERNWERERQQREIHRESGSPPQPQQNREFHREGGNPPQQQQQPREFHRESGNPPPQQQQREVRRESSNPPQQQQQQRPQEHREQPQREARPEAQRERHDR